MSQIKNINKVLLAFVVLANFYISFDFINYKEFGENKFKIEQVFAQFHSEKDFIEFDQINQTDDFIDAIQFQKEKVDFVLQTKNQNRLEQINYRVQKVSFFDNKPIRLQILINDISIQKSHCI